MIKRWLKRLVDYLFADHLAELRAIRELLELMVPQQAVRAPGPNDQIIIGLGGAPPLGPLTKIDGVKIFDANEE